METHPVPQNISSYEFRLVGDMTLKQFLQLAGGIVVGLLIFRTPLIGIIKIPLTLLSILLGVLMAFVPVNGRPFSTWFGAFMKAIYSPTEYVWMPEPEAVTAVQPETSPPSQESPDQTQATPALSGKFVPSLSSLITSKLPNIAPSSPTQTTVVVVDQPAQEPAPVAPQPKTPPSPPPQPAPQPKAAPAQPKPQEAPAPVPAAPKEVASPPSPQSASVKAAPHAEATSLISAPTTPNILAGIVNDSQGQPLNGTTVEIVDTSTGIPARALRTNRLGQFQIAIPLTPGTYNVIAEKEDLAFDPVSVQVKGNIIQPIVISAKS